MAVPTPKTANLEIRVTRKGHLEAYWKGDRLPILEIAVNHSRGEFADIRLHFGGRQVRLTTEQDDE